jgi:hypothetical protein
MLRGLLPRDHSARKAWLRRLDRVAGELNVVLVVFAIGLATLDLTFLYAEQVIDQLPPATRTVTVAQPTASSYPITGQIDLQ